MNKILFTFSLFMLISLVQSQGWAPAGNKIKTGWADKIDVASPWPEYPRPQMERSEWQSLNGLWDYAITKKGAPEPEKFDGQILVPFPVESSLSGVQKTVGLEKELWYKRSFIVPAGWNNKKILLHFGAVDWKSDVWVNNIKIGSHKGGYTPFTFDISPFLNKTGEQKLVVKVWDPTDKGFQPRGKQVTKPRGIMYTAVTGIWQTVWLEPVNTGYIRRIRSVPDIDNQNIVVEAITSGTSFGDYFEVVVKEGDTPISMAKARVGEAADLPVPDAKLWSPESPYLYHIV